MTEKDKEIQELRAELDWLMQSEAVRSMSQKDEKGNHKYDICGLDRCIKELHRRALEAEKKAQTARAEATLYRRRIEAMMTAQEEKAYPVYTNGGYQPKNSGIPLSSPPSGGSAAQWE